MIPSQLTVGDTWSWTAEFPDYSPALWTLTYYFTNAAANFSADAAADGGMYSVTVPATTTAGYSSGRYHWVARVASGGVVITLDDGWLDLLPDQAGASVDRRSWAARTLEAVEAFLEGNASTAQASMSVGGRSLSRWSLPELLQWRDQLRAEVRSEEAGSNAGVGRNIKVRYGRP